jgi:hypothetical protein
MALFKKRVVIAPTGNAADDALLAKIAGRSDLQKPRHWVHYFYARDEKAARSAAQTITQDGWEIQRIGAGAPSEPWIVIAEKHDVILTPGDVRSAREFFLKVASGTDGGEYDGWQASL